MCHTWYNFLSFFFFWPQTTTSFDLDFHSPVLKPKGIKKKKRKSWFDILRVFSCYCDLNFLKKCHCLVSCRVLMVSMEVFMNHQNYLSCLCTLIKDFHKLSLYSNKRLPDISQDNKRCFWLYLFSFHMFWEMWIYLFLHYDI